MRVSRALRGPVAYEFTPSGSCWHRRARLRQHCPCQHAGGVVRLAYIECWSRSSSYRRDVLAGGSHLSGLECICQSRHGADAVVRETRPLLSDAGEGQRSRGPLRVLPCTTPTRWMLQPGVVSRTAAPSCSHARQPPHGLTPARGAPRVPTVPNDGVVLSMHGQAESRGGGPWQAAACMSAASVSTVPPRVGGIG